MKKYILTLILGIFNFISFGQIYSHNFGTTVISGNPYTVAPTTLNANLSSSSWSTSNSTGFVDFAGLTGKALSITLSPAGTKTYSLTFNVTSGYYVDINSFSFWARRSGTGATAWSMSINSIAVGSGTLSGTTGVSIPTTTVSNPVQNLTSSVTVVLTITGGASGSTFRLDDFVLNGSVSTVLPITLMSFTAQKRDNCNLLEWSTASEINNDYFLLERSTDGINWNLINKTTGAGNSNYLINYSFNDYNFENTVNYYRLTQVDYNGVFETFNIVYANNAKKTKKVIGVINTSGQEVTIDTKGLLIITYEDGSSIRIMN